MSGLQMDIKLEINGWNAATIMLQMRCVIPMS